MCVVIELPASVKKTIRFLNMAGFEAYVVGGCVRDSIMRRIPNDWDVTTNAKPHEIKACIHQKTIDTGIKHGTVSVIYKDMNVEVTSYRIDGVYSDNRRPDNVIFTSDLKEDLKRRDFTINAMAYNPDTGIIDCFNGLHDIKNKIIRCVGEPKDRFAEDALRIMRAYRFAATLDFDIDKDTIDASAYKMNLLEKISVERITSEFNKILLSDNAGKYIKKMLDVGVFRYVIHEFENIKGFKEPNSASLDFLDHILLSVDNTPKDLVLRLTLLLQNIANQYCFAVNEEDIKDTAEKNVEMVNNILKRLKYDNKTLSVVKELVSYNNVCINTDEISVKRILKKIGAERLEQLLKVKRANIMAEKFYDKRDLSKLDTIEMILSIVLEEGQCYCLKDLVLNGTDLMAMGLKGKEIGRVLNTILDMVIENLIINDKEVLIKTAKNIIEKDFYDKTCNVQ